MATKARINLMDYSSEMTGMNFYVPDLTASNFDDVVASIAALRVAGMLLTDCAGINSSLSWITSVAPFSPATVSTAQREIALKVTFRDTVNGRVGHFTVPGPKSTLYPPSGTDVVPLSNLVAEAFIAVFEANAVSRDGNPVEVTQIRLIGRNS